MKEKKIPLLVLGGISLLLIAVCILMLTDIIKLPARTPQGGGPTISGPTADPTLEEAAKEVYAQQKSYEEQVDNYFTGLKMRNPELLLGLYYPLYWESAGQTVAEALEMMQDNVNELELPGDLNWKIIGSQPPTEQKREMIQGTYEVYELKEPITDMITLDIETRTSINGVEETNTYQLSFLQIEGSWYLFDDIFQVYY